LDRRHELRVGQSDVSRSEGLRPEGCGTAGRQSALYATATVDNSTRGPASAGPHVRSMRQEVAQMTKQFRIVICTAVSALGLIAFVNAQAPQVTQTPDAPPTWIPDIKFAS